MSAKILAAALLAALLCSAAAGCGAGEDAPPVTPPAANSAPQEHLGTPPPVTPGSASSDDGPLTETERLGGLRIGQSREEAARLLGEPHEQTEPEYWAADGLNHSRWTYEGVELSFAEETLESITVTEPFAGETNAGIRIGFAASEVREAYGQWIDQELSAQDQIIAGTPYGGLFFTLEDETVTKIVLGAGAE